MLRGGIDYDGEREAGQMKLKGLERIDLLFFDFRSLFQAFCFSDPRRSTQVRLEKKGIKNFHFKTFV